ncbi:MAG: hypothetical protein AMJ69_01800 [Gammaproteobacteria bacterium SG8_47]|nr:MAG: hypothetical protein AMJ69_01800 [Gammaproteobacteria bacterium SG8_47]
MKYAVVINLDYSSHPQALLGRLWQDIKHGMEEAGFARDGRCFTIQLPREQACALARSVMEQLAAQSEYHAHHIHSYLKDFYGYDVSATTNLLVAPLDGIVVRQERED